MSRGAKGFAWTPENLQSLGALVRRLGYPADAFRFVLDAIILNEPVRTADVGTVIRRFAEAHFGDEAQAVLESWNVLTSDDLAVIINGLVTELFLLPQVTDSLADLQGKFTILELFEVK